MTVLLITVTLRGSSAADVLSPPTKMPTYCPSSCPGDDVVGDHDVVDLPAVVWSIQTEAAPFVRTPIQLASIVQGAPFPVRIGRKWCWVPLGWRG